MGSISYHHSLPIFLLRSARWHLFYIYTSARHSTNPSNYNRHFREVVQIQWFMMHCVQKNKMPKHNHMSIRIWFLFRYFSQLIIIELRILLKKLLMWSGFLQVKLPETVCLYYKINVEPNNKNSFYKPLKNYSDENIKISFSPLPIHSQRTGACSY